MPYMHLDLPRTYPMEIKCELATRLCKLYPEVMETQPWRPNTGSWSSSHRILAKRSSAMETGPQTGHPPKPLRAEARSSDRYLYLAGKILHFMDEGRRA